MKRILFLSPHTDDAELGAGGAIARFVEEGHHIWCIAFSAAEKQQLEEEFALATHALGIPEERAMVYNFPRHDFPSARQVILQHMVGFQRRLEPDWIFVPCRPDRHQDHQVVTAEAMRAFKLSSILGYEMPWNNLVFEGRFFIRLSKEHVEQKVKALMCYESQKHRTYLNEKLMWGLAMVRGTQIEQPFAEAFEVLRWVM